MCGHGTFERLVGDLDLALGDDDGGLVGALGRVVVPSGGHPGHGPAARQHAGRRRHGQRRRHSGPARVAHLRQDRAVQGSAEQGRAEQSSSSAGGVAGRGRRAPHLVDGLLGHVAHASPQVVLRFAGVWPPDVDVALGGLVAGAVAGEAVVGGAHADEVAVVRPLVGAAPRVLAVAEEAAIRDAPTCWQ